jgi:Fe-S oxidoreductase
MDELELDRVMETVTYHDPCRLGRYLGIYDEPRIVIESIPGIELVEMRKNRANALCCGSTGWVSCGRCAKEIQMERLRQAQATGATRMITVCPKCRIHLSCALKDVGDEISVTLEDLTGLLVRALGE